MSRTAAIGGRGRLLCQRDPAAAERLRAYKTMAWIDYFGDQERLVYDCLAMLNSSEQARFYVGAVLGSSAVGLIFDLVGLFGFARRYHDRAVTLTEGIEDAIAIARAHHLLGYHKLFIGECDETLQSLRRAGEIYRGAGALREWGAVEALIGWGLNTTRGEFDAALERSRGLVQMGQDGGDPQMIVWGFNIEATAERCFGHFESAESTSRAALDLARSIPDYGAQAIAGANLGCCHLRRGELTEAIVTLEETNHLIDERGFKGYEISLARNALAEAYLAEAERASGLARGRALTNARRACRVALKHGHCFRGGLPAAMRSQGTWAWLKGKHDTARRWWDRSLTVAQELGAQYETAMTSLEIGRRLGEHELLERAIQVFGEVRAESDLATARALRTHRGAMSTTKQT